MMKLIVIILMILALALPVSALELEAPAVPAAGRALMPQDTDSFSEGFAEILQKAVSNLRPDLMEAIRISLGIVASALLVSILEVFSDSAKKTAALCGTATIAATLLHSTQSMIHLATNTIQDLNSYGKLLFPVMTTAMAAQGGITSSAAIYAGTAVFDTIMTAAITRFLIPVIYLFLVMAIANSAIGEEHLKKLRDLLKMVVSWFLKIILTVFTTYMSITGVISGTTDAAALKATKITISSVVPVVGSILSDASEAVLVSAGLAKNAAGVYGIFAILALCLQPFLRIGAHYMVLKVTSAICCILGNKGITTLVDDFSAAMGLLLAITGGVCLLVLVSTICFLKGVGS